MRIKTTTFFLLTLLFLSSPAAMMPRLAAEEQAAAPDPALELLYSANGLYNRKLYDLAAEQYRRFLSEHGKHERVREARLGLGLSLFGAGRMEEAEEMLATLAADKQIDGREQVYLLRGQALLALERHADAEKVFNDALEATKERDYQERYLAGLIEALSQQEKSDELSAATDRLVKLDAKSPFAVRALYQSGLLFYRAGNFAEAAARFSQVAGRDEALEQQVQFLLGECLRQTDDLKGAADRYRAAAEAGKGVYRVDALFRLGYTRFLLGDFEDSRRALEEFLEEAGDDHPAVGQARFYVGRTHFEANRFGDAEKVFRELEQQQPDMRAEAALWTGKSALRQEQRAKEAGEALRHVLEAAPGTPESEQAAQLLAFHLHQQKAYEPAAETAAFFLKHHAGSPAAPEVAFLQAESLFLSDNHDAAIAAFSDFIEEHPAHEQAPAAMMRLAQTLAGKEDWERVFDLTADLPAGGKTPPEALYLGGVAAYRLERWPDATKRLGDFSQNHAGHANAPSALFLGGMAAEQAGDLAGAVERLESLTGQHPKSPHSVRGLMELGRIQLARKEWDAARRALEEFLKDHADHERAPEALYHLGWIELEEDRTEQAVARFSQLADKHRDHRHAPDARFQQALLLDRLGKPDESRKAIEAFLSAHQDDPRRDQALFHHGTVLIALEEWGVAGEPFRRLLNDFEKSPLRDRALYQLAWVERENGKPEEAAKLYRQLIERHGDSPLARNAVFELTELAHAAEDHETLIATIEPLLPTLDEEPGLQAQALFRLGSALFAQERYLDAARRFEEQLEIESESELAAAAAFQAGEARLRAREHPAARSNYEKALAAQAGPAIREQALLRLGEVEALTDRWAESEGYYRDLLKEFPKGDTAARAHMGLGWSLENQRKYDDAIAAYRVAVRLGGRDETAARSQFQIGECYFAQGEYDEAIKELIKVEINYAYPSWSSKALLEIARSLQRTDRPKEALTQYREVLEKYPDTTAAEVAQAELKKLRPN